MDPAPGPESPSPVLPTFSRRSKQRKGGEIGLLALLIPVFVLSLVFSRGNPLPGVAVLLLVALVLGLVFGSARTGANLRAVLARPETAGAVALMIPAMAISGVFGGPWLMLAVLALAFAGLLLAAFRGVALVQEATLTPPAPSSAAQPPAAQPPAAQLAPAALPAQPSAEVLPPLDVRELCRGLPPALAGEVLATVDHLEAVEVQARQGGDVRRSFDARQGLGEYLPETVRAWKAQREGERDPAELARALTQIQRVAGPDTFSSESARRAWETQQRFLESRAGRPPGDPE